MNLSGQELYNAVVADPRYAAGLLYGKPRLGHQEGTVGNHLLQLQANLFKLRPIISEKEFWDLEVLIAVHDICKISAKRGAAIEDSQSHASLAAKFLAEFTDNDDLINMVQYHDEGLALYKQWAVKGTYSLARYGKLFTKICDWDLFMFFVLIDGYTPSKEHEKIRWFADEVNKGREIPRMYEAMELFRI